MKNSILFALLFSVACNQPVDNPRWFDGAPNGEPTMLANYDEPGDLQSGAASFADGRFVYAKDSLLHFWSDGGTEKLSPWSDESVPGPLGGTPIVIDGVIVFSLGGVATDGEVLWPGPRGNAPMAVDGLVLTCMPEGGFGGGCTYTLLNPHTGDQMWTDTVVTQASVAGANADGFCLSTSDGVRVFDADGVQRLATSLGSNPGSEDPLTLGGHACTATPWGSIVSYSDFVTQTHRVVGFGTDGVERWSVDLGSQSAEDLAQVHGYLDGALVRTDSGVRRLGPDGTEVWGPNTLPMFLVHDVAPNGDMLVSVLNGNSLHAVHEDGTPFMKISTGPSTAGISILHAAFDGGGVVVTTKRSGILDQDRWARIVFWE